MNYFSSLDNSTASPVILTDPVHIRLEAGASIRHSSLAGSLSIGKMSCLSAVSIAQYFNLGSFSFLSHCHIGRYVSIVHESLLAV